MEFAMIGIFFGF